jgi:hypothetical protein
MVKFSPTGKAAGIAREILKQYLCLIGRFLGDVIDHFRIYELPIPLFWIAGPLWGATPSDE